MVDIEGGFPEERDSTERAHCEELSAITAANIDAGRAALEPTARFRLFGVTAGDLDAAAAKLKAQLPPDPTEQA